MEKIIWTKLAFQDIDDIDDYISKDSEAYARKTIESFFKRVQVLVDFTEAGRIVPEIGKKQIRELIEGNYRIIYTAKKNMIYILRVHHASRLITKSIKLK
ncbi:MAG: type II toxin-antitoxin system RelE/ParE family toxin [Bacteroidia bacterium]